MIDYMRMQTYINWELCLADGSEVENKNLKKGAIVLLHTIHYETVEALDQLIPALKAKGYELVTVSELLHEKKHRFRCQC